MGMWLTACENFGCRFVADNKIKLHWQAVSDPRTHCPTRQHIVYRSMTADLTMVSWFIMVLKATSPGQNVYSYKITAVNRGGESPV